MRAAMVCFAKHGFHQTSMHDISGEAGISVGLIYRYFENKDAVISAMADAHKEEIQELLDRARQAPSLLEALELFFTAHCCSDERQIECAFVVDLFAEGSRNPGMARLVRDVLDSLIDGVTARPDPSRPRATAAARRPTFARCRRWSSSKANASQNTPPPTPSRRRWGHLATKASTSC